MNLHGYRIGFIILLGCMSFLFSCSPPEETKKENGNKAVPVRVMEMSARDLPVVVEPVGRLTANREVSLSAEVGGRVASYEAEVGDRVEEGRVLVKIDPTDYKLALDEASAALAAAEAQLSAAKKAYGRFRDLLAREVVSKNEFDRIEAEYKSSEASADRARAARDIAEERLKKTEIKVPFDGHVAGRLIELGQTLAPGQPVMTIAEMETMRVKVWLSESDIVNVDPDDPVVVAVDALGGAEFPGRIDRIGIKADARTNTFEVEVLVENPDLVLKSGLSARVRLTVRIVPGVLMAPQSAVLYREDRKEVYVVSPGDRAVLREVELGLTRGSMIQVVEGLHPGDRLVVTGGQYLSPGDPVEVTDTAPVESPTPPAASGAQYPAS